MESRNETLKEEKIAQRSRHEAELKAFEVAHHKVEQKLEKVSSAFDELKLKHEAKVIELSEKERVIFDQVFHQCKVLYFCLLRTFLYESHKLESLATDNREFAESLQTSKVEADSLRGEVLELVPLLPFD